MSQRLLKSDDHLISLSDTTRNTPDWMELKRDTRDEFPIFVTGSMRRWRENARFLSGCNYYGMAQTWGENFILTRPRARPGQNTVPDPIMFQLDSDKTNWEQTGEYFDQDRLRGVEGEVYGVPLRKLAQLDIHEQNGDGVNRQKLYVNLINPKQKRANVRCFAYVADVDEYMKTYAPSDNLEYCGTIATGGGKEFYRA